MLAETGPRQALVTEVDVAAYLDKKPATVRWWRCKGYGPPFLKVGRSVRYRWADIDAWIAAQNP